MHLHAVNQPLGLKSSYRLYVTIDVAARLTRLQPLRKALTFGMNDLVSERNQEIKILQIGRCRDLLAFTQYIKNAVYFE